MLECMNPDLFCGPPTNFDLANIILPDKKDTNLHRFNMAHQFKLAMCLNEWFFLSGMLIVIRVVGQGQNTW